MLLVKCKLNAERGLPPLSALSPCSSMHGSSVCPQSVFIDYSGTDPAPLFYPDPARKFPTLLATSRFIALVM